MCLCSRGQNWNSKLGSLAAESMTLTMPGMRHCFVIHSLIHSINHSSSTIRWLLKTLGTRERTTADIAFTKRRDGGDRY